MNTAPEVSFVIPVFKKANVLPEVLRALRDQQIFEPVEYIFVDDASPDDSVAILKRLSNQFDNFQIIENETNAGPSVRLNQGVRAARGRYLCLIDADELIVPNAVATMLRLLKAENAQIIHGKVAHSDLPATDIHPAPMPQQPEYLVSDSPLSLVANGRGFVRMTWLVQADIFRKSGGCDEAVFVQDESFALRIASYANRMIDLRAKMTYAPRIGSHISSNQAQLLHDRFLAHYNMLRDNPALNADIQRALSRKCISSAWKAVNRAGLPFNRWTLLALYGCTKLGLPLSTRRILDRLHDAFGQMTNVRRVSQPVDNKA